MSNDNKIVSINVGQRGESGWMCEHSWMLLLRATYKRITLYGVESVWTNWVKVGVYCQHCKAKVYR